MCPISARKYKHTISKKGVFYESKLGGGAVGVQLRLNHNKYTGIEGFIQKSNSTADANYTSSRFYENSKDLLETAEYAAWESRNRWSDCFRF